jgi:DNA-binding transcriptional LysR family regulator
MPDRIVEMSSYHAMLGCAVAGMGISLMPRMVLKTFPDAALLSVHPLPPEIARAQTLLIWRKGARSPKINALLEVLTDGTGTAGSQRVRKSRKAA